MNLKNLEKYNLSIFLVLFLILVGTMLILGSDPTNHDVLGDVYAKPLPATERSMVMFILFYISLFFGIITLLSKKHTRSLILKKIFAAITIISTIFFMIGILKKLLPTFPTLWIIFIELIFITIGYYIYFIFQNTNKHDS